MEMLSPHPGGGIFEALDGHMYGNYSNSNTLVMLHGFGTDQHVWHYLIPVLACFFRVVVFDMAFTPNVRPGLYDADKYSNYTAYADDLLGVLDQLQLDKVIYLGHSMSAMVGCIAAVKKPELFQQLILLSGSPRYLNAEGYYGGFSLPEVEGIFNQISQNYQEWVEDFAQHVIIVNDSQAQLEFEQDLLRMDPTTTLGLSKVVFLSDWRVILPQVTVPTILMSSKEDHVVPVSVDYYMEKEMGGPTQLNLLPTSGHFPMLTAHDLLLRALGGVLGIKNSTSKC
ncbi:hypothetical protein Ancab_013707 [Ancistrocladus abbreviatus]